MSRPRAPRIVCQQVGDRLRAGRGRADGGRTSTLSRATPWTLALVPSAAAVLRDRDREAHDRGQAVEQRRQGAEDVARGSEADERGHDGIVAGGQGDQRVAVDLDREDRVLTEDLGAAGGAGGDHGVVRVLDDADVDERAGAEDVVQHVDAGEPGGDRGLDVAAVVGLAVGRQRSDDLGVDGAIGGIGLDRDDRQGAAEAEQVEIGQALVGERQGLVGRHALGIGDPVGLRRGADQGGGGERREVEREEDVPVAPPTGAQWTCSTRCRAGRRGCWLSPRVAAAAPVRWAPVSSADTSPSESAATELVGNVDVGLRQERSPVPARAGTSSFSRLELRSRAEAAGSGRTPHERRAPGGRLGWWAQLPPRACPVRPPGP